VPATLDRKAINWYRLEGLLHDADGKLLNGWVREDVGDTPWISPWDWDGYEVLHDYGRPIHAMALFLSNMRRFSEAQLERYRHLADDEDQGPIRSRLFDIIDPNRLGQMKSEELQKALRLPAQAQAIAQMIIRKESEWFHRAHVWDALDEMLGHSGSTPHLNWLAEKQRIKELSWWEEVAEKVGLPSWGKAYHVHPIGLVGSFYVVRPKSDLIVRQGQVTFDAEGNDIQNSPYFSRRLHWPGGASGVTLGRGYDMRHRTQNAVLSDLIAAGVQAVLAENFSRGAGLSGQNARDFVNANREQFGAITQEAQRILFEDVVYPRYEIAAQRQYNSAVLSSAATWEQLDRRVRDVAVDFTYQQGSIWNRQMPHISKNNREDLATYIQEIQELIQYEQGRHRARYLRAKE